MAITESDIKLLKSARMTDTADGGGQMTGNVVQSGVDNNIFDDVSALDRVYGNVSLRKVFPAVLTNTTDKFLGARVIIDKPPADSYVSGTLFAASSLFDVRSEAQGRVEAYLAAGAPYMGLLYGPHIEGMMVVSLLQRVERGLPSVGQVLILKKEIGEPGEVEQFVRITNVSAAYYSFTDANGDYTRMVVTCSISDPLRTDFPGWEAVRVDSDLDYAGKSRVFESVVANAAQYYSIKSLQNAASIGDYNIKVDSSYAQLLPSSQVESPLSGLDPYADASLPVPGISSSTYTVGHDWTTTKNMNLPGGCLPGSLSITVGGLVVTDSAGKLMSSGVQIGTIDYESGQLVLSTGNLSGPKSVTYSPAAVTLRAPQSTEIEVTVSSRSQTYSGFTATLPQPGTFSVSYLAEGRWYSLADRGDGVLVGADSGYGAGTINTSTGSFVVTLGALPDVGSSLIVTWGTPTQETAHPSVSLTTAQTIQITPPPGMLIQPGSLTVSWTDGGSKTATVSTAGVVSGHATGSLSPSTAKLEFSPTTLPAVGTQLTIDYVAGPKQTDTFAHPARDGNGKVPVAATLGAITPGSLEVEWDTLTDVAVLGVYTRAQLTEMGMVVVDPTNIARDDGAGNVVLNGSNIGTVNYTTGAVLFNPDVVIKIPRPVYASVPTSVGGRWRLNYSGLEYINAPSLYPNDTSGRVVLRYNSAGSTSSQTQTVTFSPSFKLVPGILAKVVPGSVLLGGADQPWGDNGQGALREFTATGWLTRGSIDYLTGTVSLTTWPTGLTNSLTRINCVTTAGEEISSEYVFRTASAPLRPGSLSVSFSRSTGGVQVVTGNTVGIISAAGVTGSVDHDTGIVRLRFGTVVAAAGNEAEPWYHAENVNSGYIFKPEPVAASTIKYAAVAYSYLPLDADILGLDPVRLPTDGRVPVFKAGRVAVVHNTQSLPAATVSNGQTVNCGRTLLSRIRVFGNDGLEITSGFSKNLDAGTITFTNVAGYSQPVTVEHRIEDEALCADVQISGQIRLSRPLTHNYPVPGTYVSSAYVQGTLQAAAQDAFSQLAWTNVWSNSIIGDPILAQYNDTANPIVVTNAGAITERWAIIFQTNTTFNLVGEEVGVILSGSTGADLAPVNPATGVPYFTLAAAGWGTGWVAGNVLRFNTAGANFPLWVARTVMQSPAAAPGTDQLVISIRGDIDV